MFVLIKRKEFRRSVNIRNKSRVTLVIYLKFCYGMRLEKMVRGQSPCIAKGNRIYERSESVSDREGASGLGV